ncbi:hypothetical protein [Saccharothrix xinjiangensis]|uniref:Uncharacterized protein n=1 Tax=Saccharothrix xinjiangensis TaxID=204798 RepID=A0ABV9YB00_9PSEU
MNETLVGVFEKPTTTSFLLKNKGYGAIVTGANGTCDWTHYNPTENREYLAVDIDIAEDGIGWMRRAALVKI